MTQTFYGYMAQFLKEKNAKNVVEIGSDIQLKLALNLARHVENFYSVNYKEHHNMMMGWYDMHQNMGVNNIKLLSGDALQLPSLIPHADVIIIQNVLIDANMGKDTELMWKYRRGELKYTDEEWTNLVDKFTLAEENAYRGFLQVAKPGHIIRFQSQDDSFRSLLTEKLGVEPSKISTKNLWCDNDRLDVYEAYIIDNSR